MKKPGDPSRATITYSVADRQYSGDIYVPKGRAPRAAAVAVPGVVAEGKDDPRLVAFATSLARAGFLVLAPDIPNVRALEIGSSDAEFVSAAAQYLAGETNSGRAGSVALFAFSYSAGPAIIAALRPETRDLVRFVCAVGGYYDVEAVITFLTTGYYRDKADEWARGHPSPYAKWVFVLSNAARIENVDDRRSLKAIAERKLRDDGADVSDLVDKLGPEGRAVDALVANTEPERVRALIAAQAPAIRREMDALDLSKQDLKSLKARLILLHGLDDTLVPYTESMALARAAPRASLFLIASFGHVEPRLSSLPDILKFWRAAYEILRERDSMPEIRQHPSKAAP